MKAQVQIPRKFLGCCLPFFYKTIEMELNDEGLITFDPPLQKGEQVQVSFEYKGKS